MTGVAFDTGASPSGMAPDFDSDNRGFVESLRPSQIPDGVLIAFRRLIRKADLFGDSADRVLIGPKSLLIGRSPQAAERIRAVRAVLARLEGGE